MTPFDLQILSSALMMIVAVALSLPDLSGGGDDFADDPSDDADDASALQPLSEQNTPDLLQTEFGEVRNKTLSDDGIDRAPMADTLDDVTEPPTAPTSVTDYRAGEDTIVVEFDAETDPGELTVTPREGGGGATVALGGVPLAEVTSEDPIDPDEIVLRGV